MLRTVLRGYHDSFRGLPRKVWVLALCLLINRLGTMVLPFLELYLVERQGLAVDVAGRFVALYGAGAILGVSLGGKLTDRFGSRRVQLTSLVLHAALMLVLREMRGPFGIGGVLLAGSLAAETFRPANGAAISAAVGPEKRARAFSLMSLAVNLGLALGLPLGGWLAEIDFGWLFRVDAATALIAAAVLWRLGERSGVPARRPGAPAPAPAPAPATAVEPPAVAREAPSPWRDRTFLWMVALQALMTTVLFQVFGSLPVFLGHDLGLDKEQVGRVLAINSAGIVVFQMLVMRRIEGRELLPWIGFGSLWIGLGYGLNAFAGGAWMAALSIAVWTGGELFFFPLGLAWATQRAPAGSEGRYLGVHLLSSSVPFVLAPLLGTALYEHAGPRPLWLACALAGLGAWAGCRLLFSRLRAPSPAGDDARGRAG